MEKLLVECDEYRIWQADMESIQELAEFVVFENGKHHHANKTKEEIEKDVENVYQEELLYDSDAYIYLVRSKSGKVIGSIRVFQWDKQVTLPIEKIFGINPLTSIGTHLDYWHVGRFAIDSFSGISTIKLFKQLMAMAIHPILQHPNGCLIAETDIRLLKVMNLLGIATRQLGPSTEHLSSETVPICSSRDKLTPFYQSFCHLWPLS